MLVTMKAHHIQTALIFGAAALAAAGVQAQPSAVSVSGFTLNHREEIKVSSDDAWKAIVQVQKWWSGQHSYSGQASNLSLELTPGGCWCERWGDGNLVVHGQVVMVQTGRVIRLYANLGPLQDLPVHGVFTIATGTSEGRTMLRMTYRVGGSSDAGLDKLAPAVDRVIAEAYKRLKLFVETGRPD